MKSLEELYSLSGKVVLVTGGSRGLGREISLGCAKAGADVVIVSRKIEACEAVAEEVRSLGRRAFPFACHLGRWEQINELVDAVNKEFGEIDVLVNNAGMSPNHGPLEEVTEQMWDSVFNLNVKGPFRLSSLVGSQMFNGDGGSIINISSIAAVQPSPDAVPYSSAKAGLNALTLALAGTYGPKVRVNCIMAGPFLTDISKHWDMEAAQKRYDAFSPLKRAGNPDEIVGTVLYYASEASSYTTGTIIPVDGGIGMRK